MLPTSIRERMLEKTSVKTMRHVRAVPMKRASGLVKRTYDMIVEDFFINGSFSSHSKVPELLAGTWLGGREIVLVKDKVDRTTKEAMSATLSYVNDCPYCADMLVSLVHGAGKHTAASQILREDEAEIGDPILRGRLAWVRAVATNDASAFQSVPFSDNALPEAIGTLFVLNYVNRFSHVAMDGSPVGDMFKSTALRIFGYELRTTTERPITPGRALELLPDAPLPKDMLWAAPNARVAGTLARWAAAIERESHLEVPCLVRDAVHQSLQAWNGEKMPLSKQWVEDELQGLTGDDRKMAKLVLLVAKASYQVVDADVKAVLGPNRNETRLIRVLSFAAFSASRRLAALTQSRTDQSRGNLVATTRRVK